MSALAEPLEYVEGGGPGIPELPELTQEDLAAAQDAAPAPPEIPGWETGHFETILTGFGEGVHLMVGVGENDWKMTRADLDRIAEPLCRIANRYEPLRRASVYADPIMVAYGFGMWGWRSALERARVLTDEAEEQQALGGVRYERTDQQPAEEEPPAPGPGAALGDFVAERPAFPQASVPRMRR